MQAAGIQTILDGFRVAKLTDENFEVIYAKVVERLIEESDQADIPCIDCHRPYDVVVGASNVRCLRCNRIYLSRQGGPRDWHTWVFGKSQKPRG